MRNTKKFHLTPRSICCFVGLLPLKMIYSIQDDSSSRIQMAAFALNEICAVNDIQFCSKRPSVHIYPYIRWLGWSLFYPYSKPFGGRMTDIGVKRLECRFRILIHQLNIYVIYNWLNFLAVRNCSHWHHFDINWFIKRNWQFLIDGLQYIKSQFKIQHSSWVPSQYPKRRLPIRSRKVSKPRDLYLELSDLSEIWQAVRQQCCRCACPISKRYDNLKYRSRGFETLRDLTERRLIGYWNRVLVPIEVGPRGQLTLLPCWLVTHRSGKCSCKLYLPMKCAICMILDLHYTKI